MMPTFIWSSKMRCLRQYQFSCKSWRMIFNCKRSRRWRRRREIIFCHHFKHVSPGMWFGKWIWLPVSVVCAAARTDSSSTRCTLGSIHILFWILHLTNKLGALSKKDQANSFTIILTVPSTVSPLSALVDKDWSVLVIWTELLIGVVSVKSRKYIEI